MIDMGLPQIILLVLIACVFGVRAGVTSANSDGTLDNTHAQNFGIWMVKTVFWLGLLYWGGFFS